MNYYIQGNAANADQIKAAFENKGYSDKGFTFDVNDILFFTANNKHINVCPANGWLANLIKTHPDYKELELPVEPKFKVGNWVVSTRNQILTYRILEPNISNELGKLDYKVEIYSDGIYEKTCLIPSSKMDEWGRLWTIADAKDGDVLATDNGWACIFKAFDGWTFSSYCFMDSQNWFCEFGSEVHTPDSRINGNIHPATKEQRDLLFKKMKKAGYTWDEKKKELKKIPVKPRFKVGDWIVRGEGFVYEPSIITEIRDYYICELLNGERVTYTLNDVHKNFHLWTLADAKDGDVLAVDWHQDDDDDSWEKIVIFKKYHAKGVKGLFNRPCVEGYGNTFKNGKLAYDEEVPYYSKTWTDKLQPATKEQRDLMFTRIREAGYEWDADKKELNKIQPHYGISNFNPFDKVLVRCGNDEEWMIEFYCKYDTLVHTSPHRDYPFMGIGDSYSQCIPFNEETKHLLGTNDMCDEQYINW